MRRSISISTPPSRSGTKESSARTALHCIAGFLILALVMGAAPSEAQLGSALYRIGPRDVLEIKVREIPDLNLTLPVSGDGSVMLPMVGSFHVRGLTEAQAATKLKELLESRYVQTANVSIRLDETVSNPIRVVVEGDSGGGSLPGSETWTLRDALWSLQVGVRERGARVVVSRRARNGLTDDLTLSAWDLMVDRDPEVDIPLFPGDLVRVLPPSEITVLLVGGSGAGEHVIRAGTSLFQFLATGGGLQSTSSSKVEIRRLGPDSKLQTRIEANYRRILKGKDPDLPLEDGDIIVVKESFI